MLNSMADPNYHMFRLPWWDWRRESQMTTGLGADDLFVANRAGYSKNVSGRPVVAGDLFGEGWETMCWFRVGQICDPTENTGLLQRCPFTGTNPCSTSNPDWPSAADVLTALVIPEFDVAPYNIQTVGGYRTFVDFQIGTVSVEDCRDDRQCRCVPSLDPSCATNTAEPTQKSGMHLLVSVCDVLNIIVTVSNYNYVFQGHIIMGQGDFNFRLNNDMSTIGTIEDVAASPNDPMFILHHNMIDCIFIEWMRRFPNAEYPMNVSTVGHARDGFIIPFFPLYTNNDLFVSAEELGYSCNLFGGAVNTSMSVSLLLILGMLAFALTQ